MGANSGGDGVWQMPTILKTAVTEYLRVKESAQGTRNEYLTTLKNWAQWGRGVPLDNLGRKDIREFLDWVYEQAVAREGKNPGRTANKAREQLCAVMTRRKSKTLSIRFRNFRKPSSSAMLPVGITLPRRKSTHCTSLPTR